MSEKIIVNSSNGQKTIPNINPAVQNRNLKTFGEKLTALTNGTHEKTERIIRNVCNDDHLGGVKPEPTLTLSRTTATVSELTSGVFATITTNSTGNLYVRPATLQSGPVYSVDVILYDESGATTVRFTGNSSTVAQTVYIGVTETDTYAAKEVAFTITA